MDAKREKELDKQTYDVVMDEVIRLLTEAHSNLVTIKDLPERLELTNPAHPASLADTLLFQIEIAKISKDLAF